MTLAAFAKTGSQTTKINWPKAITQTVNNRTLKAVCEKQTYCTDISANDLNDPAVFKISSLNESTILISYKNIFANIEHDSQKASYKVNQKSLTLEQIKNVKQLKEQILEKLPNGKHAAYGFSWISVAQADFASPAQFQITMALTRLILATEENEICQQTLKIASQCEQFSKEATAALKPLAIISPSRVPQVDERALNEKAVLKTAYEISSMMSHMDIQMNSISPSKKEAIERCECQGGSCKLAEKTENPTELGQQFKTCVADAKKLKVQMPSSVELQERLDKIEEFLNEAPVAGNSPPAPTEKDFTKNSNGR